MTSNSQKVTVRGNEVILLKEKQLKKRVKFPYDVAQVLDFSNVFVVRIESPLKSRFNENVYGVSYDGKILWQVGPRKYVYEDSPYTGMIKEDEKVKLFNWDGTELLVNPMTGRVLKEEYGK